MADFHQARLQYEILGHSAPDIAEDLGTALYMVEDRIRLEEWKYLWPETGLENLGHSEQADKIIEDSNLRLKVYSILLACRLAPKYAELEYEMIKAATIATKDSDITPSALASISRVYAALKNNSNSINQGLDEISLIPEVIVKNLSGKSIQDLEVLNLL